MAQNKALKYKIVFRLCCSISWHVLFCNIVSLTVLKRTNRTIKKYELDDGEIGIRMTAGGYSTDVWVGRCGRGAQSLTLFKTEISDFPTLFKTASRILRPFIYLCCGPSFRHQRQQKKGTNSAFCTIKKTKVYAFSR